MEQHSQLTLFRSSTHSHVEDIVLILFFVDATVDAQTINAQLVSRNSTTPLPGPTELNSWRQSLLDPLYQWVFDCVKGFILRDTGLEAW